MYRPPSNSHAHHHHPASVGMTFPRFLMRFVCSPFARDTHPYLFHLPSTHNPRTCTKANHDDWAVNAHGCEESLPCSMIDGVAPNPFKADDTHLPLLRVTLRPPAPLTTSSVFTHTPRADHITGVAFTQAAPAIQPPERQPHLTNTAPLSPSALLHAAVASTSVPQVAPVVRKITNILPPPFTPDENQISICRRKHERKNKMNPLTLTHLRPSS